MVLWNSLDSSWSPMIVTIPQGVGVLTHWWYVDGTSFMSMIHFLHLWCRQADWSFQSYALFHCWILLVLRISWLSRILECSSWSKHLRVWCSPRILHPPGSSWKSDVQSYHQSVMMIILGVFSILLVKDDLLAVCYRHVPSGSFIPFNHGFFGVPCSCMKRSSTDVRSSKNKFDYIGIMRSYMATTKPETSIEKQ